MVDGHKPGGVMKFFSRYLLNEDGATAIEYGLITTLISVALIAIFFLMGDDINIMFTEISTILTS